jgi:hypothetical protein
VGFYTGERASVNEGAQKALKATAALAEAFASFQKILADRQVLAVRLADLAPEFSGPKSDSPQVKIVMAEHKDGIIFVDTNTRLALVNTSKQALTNCVVAVRFSDAGGKSSLSLYFVPEWQAGETRAVNFADDDYPRQTVENIERVDVQLWSTESSAPSMILKKPSAGWPEF